MAPKEPPDESSSTSHEGLDASGLRDQLTKLQGLVGLSMVMTDSADASQIARLASSAVPSLSAGSMRRGARGEPRMAGVGRAVPSPVGPHRRRKAAPRPARTSRARSESRANAGRGRFRCAVSRAPSATLSSPAKGPSKTRAVPARGPGPAARDGHRERRQSRARERATAEEIGIVNLRLERSLAIHRPVNRGGGERPGDGRNRRNGL